MSKLLRSIFIALLISRLIGEVSFAAVEVPDRISDLKPSDMRQAVIAFINISTSPGVEGSSIKLDQTNRTSSMWRSSLGFNAEFSLRPKRYLGYWGLALIGGGLSDDFNLVDDLGNPVDLKVDRNMVALRGAFGLSFPIDAHFKIRPFASLILSHIETESNAQGVLFSGGEEEGAFFFEHAVDSATGVGSVDLVYSDWDQALGVDVLARYNVMYTDAFSEENAILDTWDWSHSVFIKATLSGPTDWHLLKQKWFWNTYYSYNNYLDQSKDALGFRYLHEIGVGLDWDMHIKPLDWFGWRYIGIRAGYTFAEDVSGFNIGLSAR